jgi:hypothetical protein
MVETHDPAGWYPDPTGKHELRYWDGYAWLDNVSDQGTSGTDPLGGAPLPPPSQAAARKEAAASAVAPKSSKMPIIIAAAVAAVVIIGVAALLLTRDSGGGTAKLGDTPVTFTDQGKDANRPTVHTFDVDGNHVVTVSVKADDDSKTAGVIVETDQKTVDAVTSQISDASDVVGGDRIKDACSNLREEDIGAKGNVIYFATVASDVGAELKTFVDLPKSGRYEFVPVLVDDKGDCKAGKLTVKMQALPLDHSNVSNLSDLESLLSDDTDLSDFTD